MKYCIDNAHREFFSLYRWIEFEQLLSQSDLLELNDAIDTVLAARLEIPQQRLSRQDSKDRYFAGRDLWRDNKKLKQIVCLKRFAEMLANLVEERPLRLAFDQVIDVANSTWQPAGITLETMSSFRGLVGGLILCLKAPKNAPAPFFPAQAGNGICVSPALELNLNQIYREEGQRYLIIGYGKAVTLFVHQPDDAFAPRLRSAGYNYGDRLVDRLHPVVIR